MNIKELMSSTEDLSSVQLVVNGADLKEFAIYIMDESMKRPSEEPEKYISADETAEILKVDRSTLYRWNKSGYLKSSKVGSRLSYKMSDVKGILNSNQVVNH